MWCICCLAFNANRLGAREPRPYLDKKHSVVQVEGGGKAGGFPVRHLFFQDVKKTGSGFMIHSSFDFLQYFL